MMSKFMTDIEREIKIEIDGLLLLLICTVDNP